VRSRRHELQISNQRRERAKFVCISKQRKRMSRGVDYCSVCLFPWLANAAMQQNVDGTPTTLLKHGLDEFCIPKGCKK
jgi:hypothetical protein